MSLLVCARLQFLTSIEVLDTLYELGASDQAHTDESVHNHLTYVFLVELTMVLLHFYRRVIAIFYYLSSIEYGTLTLLYDSHSHHYLLV